MAYLKIIDDKSNDNELVLEGYVFVYGGKDFTGETFTKNTVFDSPYTRQNNVLIDWEHGKEPDNVKNQPGRDDILGKLNMSTAKSDDIGLLVEHVLDRRERYVEKFIEPMVRANLLGTSSEPVQKSISKSEDGTILSWGLKRQSFTVMPAEGRLFNEHQIQVIKSLTDDYPGLKSLLPPRQDAKNGIDENNSTLQGQQTTHNEENEMSEELLKTIQESIASGFKAQNERLDEIEKNHAELKAKAAELEDVPAPKKSGTFVTEDGDDRELKKSPFKNMGDFLYVLANEPNDNRLNPLAKTITEVGRCYNVNKALGSGFMGSLGNAATKANPTGLGETVPSAGGFLVGTERRDGIMQRVYNTGQLLQRASILPISTGNNGMILNAIDETSRADGSRQGGVQAFWASEASAKTASKPKFRQMSLKLQKVIGLVYATDELLQDATALQAFIMQSLPIELRFKVEDAMMRGTGAGQPLGVLNSNSLVVVPKEAGQAAATINSENIINMHARRYAGVTDYVWLINQDAEPQLHQLNLAVGTAGGALVFMPPGGLSGNPFSTLYGKPVITTEYNETLGTVGDIMLVAWSQYQMIDKGGIQSASSIHVRFANDETAFRFVYRVDGQPMWDSAVTPYKGVATQSPNIALATRS